MQIEPLIYWIMERESIRMKKARGEPSPWTDDEILCTYRFCNVRREDDLGTIWISENVRKPYHNDPLLWLMLCICRQISWPDTLAELIRLEWPVDDSFDLERFALVLNNRKACDEKVFTGAYMISAPAIKGTDKATYIAQTVIGDLWNRREDFEPTSLQDTHRWITRSNGWGPFMAYQAIVDMRFTSILENAPDIQTWAAAGPGTLRGLNRIHERGLKQPLSQPQACEEMQEIYTIIQRETGISIDFSDVPNILCEVDKYLRVKNGEGKPRALYVEGRGY